MDYLGNKKKWAMIFGVIFAVKLVIYSIDSLPMFFLHDSIFYIDTAIRGYIPPERSYLYGFVIRALAVLPHSLDGLIIAQIFASVITVLILIYCLENFFAVPIKLAAGLGIFCAIEPLQLLYERYILTETFSLLCFAFYVFLGLFYLKKRKLYVLVFSQIVGVVMICFRMSFLPTIYFATICLPILAWINISFLGEGRLTKTTLKTVLMHLMISLLVLFCCLTVVKEVNGYLLKRQPALHYESGLWLMGFFATIIEPEDFPRQDIADHVFDVTLDLKDPINRDAQFNWQGGIIHNMRKYVKDNNEANKLAQKTVVNAIIRSPANAINMVYMNFIEFWNVPWLKLLLDIDKGNRPLPESFQTDLKTYFELDAKEYPFLKTATNRLFFTAWPWYLFLLCSPLLAVGVIFCSKETRVYSMIIASYLLIIVAIAFILTTHPNVRYLHPAAWLVFFPVGQILKELRKFQC